MDLTNEQKLLLLSTSPGDVIASAAAHAPKRLVEECIAAGLVERIGRTSTWRLTAAGIEARRELLGE